MKWETIYEQNKNRKEQEIEKITSDFSLKTSISYLSKRKKQLLLVVCLIVFTLIIFTFYSSLKAMISSIFLFVSMLFFSFFFHTYKIEGKKGKVLIKTNGQEINLQVDKLRNIYIEESLYRIFFIKQKSYSLIILYETPNHNICDIILPTTLISTKEVQKWFSTITLKQKIKNNQQKCKQYKKKRILKKLIFYVILLFITFLFIQVHHLFL